MTKNQFARVRNIVKTHHSAMIEEKVAFVCAEYPTHLMDNDAIEDIVMDVDVCDACGLPELDEHLSESLYYGGVVCPTCRENI